MTSVQYLGHSVCNEGIKTDSDNISVLKDWSAPSDIKDLQSFLGFAGYNRCFVCYYSETMKPFNSLLVGHPANKKKGLETSLLHLGHCDLSNIQFLIPLS